MKVGIISNNERVSIQNYRILLDELEDAGFEIVKLPLLAGEEQIKGLDVIVILGGDGAILHAAVAAAKNNVKIVGVNYGTLGFLTEYEKIDLLKVVTLLEHLQKEQCRILHRTLLEINVKGNTYYALNEVAFQRDYTGQGPTKKQIISVEVCVGKENATFSGDGVLLCTPTGSTAYSLSAGGAILSAEVPAFMLTPICAFSFNSRPIVFPDTDVFVTRIVSGKALLVSDGNVLETVEESDEIIIKKAPFTADFPVESNSCLLTKIKNKLK
ncbi:MAG: NAD(+)/NADH kinase [Clostridia bacterium]|nr:NAD(+)/NADH kinase [Clostridia bacterium]